MKTVSIPTRSTDTPSTIIDATDNALRGAIGNVFVDAVFQTHAQTELDFRLAVKVATKAQIKANEQAIKDAEAELLKADLQANGTTVLGLAVSYEDLLHLATLGVKAWYEMPADSIVARLVSEVTLALKDVQSREANALKAAIAELQG
jgi:hypothetical protein